MRTSKCSLFGNGLINQWPPTAPAKRIIWASCCRTPAVIVQACYAI